MTQSVDTERPVDTERRGRPRDESIDEAVLDATRALLAEVGYRRLSIEQVAKRAEVSRPTIYLRWENKPALVHAAIFRTRPAVGLPHTNSLAEDLRALARASVRAYSAAGVRGAMLGLLSDGGADPALQRQLMSTIQGPTRSWIADALAAAAARGETTAEQADADFVFEVLFGALTQHYVVRHHSDLGFADRVIDMILAHVGAHQKDPR